MPVSPAGLDYNLIKDSFAAGELSPRMVGRVTLDRYYAGCATLENWMIYPQGGIYRRYGTRYVSTVKFPISSQGTHLVPFQFSNTQNYVLEIGNLYARFYRNGGQIQSAGIPVEVVTPYIGSDTALVKWCQSADTLYLAHQTYHPQKITRITDTQWNCTRIDFLDGPYLDANIVTTALLQPSVTANGANVTISGAVSNGGANLIRVTATAHGYSTNNWVKIKGILGTTEANGYWKITVIDANTFDLVNSAFVNNYTSGGVANLLGTLTASGTNLDGTAFTPFVTGATTIKGQLPNSGGGHVGSSWRYSSGGTTFGWITVVNVNSTTQVVIDIRRTLDGSSASSFWSEGAWSGVRGYPACNAIKDQRLIWASSSNEPQKMWASRANDYENYIPQFTQGTTVDSDAWSYRLGFQKINPIMWMADASRGLLVGTSGEEFIGSGSSGQGPITPTSVWFRLQTTYGSLSQALPVRVGFETLFVTRTGLKLRSAAYNLLQDVYIAPDKTIYSEHISYLNQTNPGFQHMVYQQEPNSNVWLARNDGQICIFTYVPEQNIEGWSRLTMENGNASVESLACIPSENFSTDIVWAIVNRRVNGQSTRYVEFFDPSVNTDSASTIDNTQTQNLTLSQTGVGSGVIATTSSPLFSPSSVGQELVCLPLPSGNLYPIPGTVYPIVPGPVPAFQSGGSGRALITGYTSPTQVTVTINNPFANSTVQGGQWGIGSFSFTGLSYLEGKTVNLVGVGFNAVYPNVVVSGGQITVPQGQPSIVKAEIGLPFTATMTTMRPDPKAGSSGETIQTDKKRWDKIKIRVQNSVDIIVDGSEINVRDATMPLGEGIIPFTGDFLLTNASNWDYDAQITIQQPNPIFTAIHAIFGRLDAGPI